MTIGKKNLSVLPIDFNMKSTENKSISNRPESQWKDGVLSAKFASKNCDQIDEMETIIVEDLVKPVIFILNYTQPFTDTITYSSEARCFLAVKGSIWRKGFCILLELLILLRLGVKTVPLISNYSNGKDNGMTTLAKGAYIIFLSFYAVIFYLYWTQTKSFCEIFNRALSLSDKLYLNERTPDRMTYVKWTARASWSFVILYITFTIVIYGVNCLKLTNFLDPTNNSNSSSSKPSRFKVDFTEIHSPHDSIVSHIVFAVVSCMNIGCCMMTFLSLGVVAAFFRQFIMLFYWKIQAMDELGLYFRIPNEIRTFNEIGKLIDTYNLHYGLMNVLGLAVVVTYISTSVEHVFSGFQNILKPGAGLHLLFSYVPMLIPALLLAEVSRVAGNFAGIIKDQFGKFTKECGDPAEALCGIAIVHYDLATSNIGIKGLGFYTVSYQFITTVLSLIVTYSIVIVQMFPHDESQANELTN